MKKAVALLIALLLLTACGSRQTAPAGLSGVVNTDGSTSMADVMAVLQESFHALHPDVTVNFSGTGSGAGVAAVLAGICDIGLSSRPLSEDEQKKGAVAYTTALDGIVLVVNPQNPISDLTTEQIRQIFTGEITSWRQLGGAALEIAVLGREAGSGTRSAFEEVLAAEGLCRYRNEYSSSGDIIGSVAANPGAIGYVSLAAVKETVSALSVDGVACTEFSVQNGSYPLQRPFLLVTAESRPLSPQAQAFLDYALSPAAAEYIALAGAIAP